MTNNEILIKTYTILNRKYQMSVEERCELQKLLREALLRDIETIDRDNFTFHLNKFEEDIFNIISGKKEKCLSKLAQMQIALDGMTEEIKGI